jgi:hypothetical protein
MTRIGANKRGLDALAGSLTFADIRAIRGRKTRACERAEESAGLVRRAPFFARE